MFTINLTQHRATPEQNDALVTDVKELAELKALLTFDAIPKKGEIKSKAVAIVAIAKKYTAAHISDKIAEYEAAGYEPEWWVRAMIGGAPFLMPALEKELKKHGIEPVYAFSKRESAETIIDGKTVKTAIFRHLGFVTGGLK